MTSHDQDHDHGHWHSQPYCPSFNSYSNNNNNRIAQIIASETNTDNEFEFQHNDAGIGKAYPLFNQDLLGSSATTLVDNDSKIQLRDLFTVEDDHLNKGVRTTSSATSSEDDDEEEEEGGIEGVPPESYCLWAPKSPEMCTKSNSTGSGSSSGLKTSRTWRLRNLLRRTKSDGKEGLMFFAAPKQQEKPNVHPANHEMKNNKNSNSSCINNKSKKSSNTTSSSNKYVINGSNKYVINGSNNYSYNNKLVYSPAREEWEKRRRSYLPYKQDLLGLFGSPQTLRKINIPPF